MQQGCQRSHRLLPPHNSSPTQTLTTIQPSGHCIGKRNMAQQSLFYSDINIETHTQMRNFHASGLTVCIACTGATQFYIYHLLEAQNYSFRAQTVLLRNSSKGSHWCLMHQTLTYHNKCVVDIYAAKPIGGLTDVSSCIVHLHLLNTQSVLWHPEPCPAPVDVAAIFGPHDEGRGVTLHRAGQLNRATQTCALPMVHPLWHPGGTFRVEEKWKL